ncbi:winged helix-turn-helix transcriptional regulator [Micromonospora sp. WMMD1120]|uniref:winged helix-turn-helix transcriptional regulator n=1 Tax=Micromonospora sp. WMMD1120 TaxID=3016106 RepID=UPI00241782CC|nr:winged helix-turn-helix transcriptional regulator [Micromonospora sp. WMMD1120]MDG4810031.1 winged helix-turn-helix transcriptional regulator [Micromonospora sp. WMMD1120]
MRREDLTDADCGIAQALGVLGDWWTFLIVRDVAGGTTRFDALQRELGISRRALTERLAALVEQGVLGRRPYSVHPPRYDYLLTTRGEGLLPVLIALQDWGTRHLMGDGTLTATAANGSAEERRAHDLVGHRVPEVALPGPDGQPVAVGAAGAWRVLYFFPGAYAPGTPGHPPGWAEIPGARGCTLESTTYARRHPDFRAAGVEVYGISTQRPDQLAEFAAYAELPFPLLSDQDGRLGAGLLLPVFRAGGMTRFKRLTLLVDPSAVVRAVQFPVTDPAGSVDEMLALVRQHTTVPG